MPTGCTLFLGPRVSSEVDSPLTCANITSWLRHSPSVSISSIVSGYRLTNRMNPTPSSCLDGCFHVTFTPLCLSIIRPTNLSGPFATAAPSDIPGRRTHTVFACLFSQIIVSIRTYAISRKEQWVKWSLIALFCALFSSSRGLLAAMITLNDASLVASMVPEFLGNVYKRKRKIRTFFRE